MLALESWLFRFSWFGSLHWWEFQGFITAQLSSRSWIKFPIWGFFSRILSEAYLLVNLYKQVPHRAGLVLVLYFTFVLLVFHDFKILSCILVCRLESEILKHIVTFCLSPFTILPFVFTCWSCRVAAGHKTGCRLRLASEKTRWLPYTQEKPPRRGGKKIEVFWWKGLRLQHQKKTPFLWPRNDLFSSACNFFLSPTLQWVL